jgi:hypothetical protein
MRKLYAKYMAWKHWSGLINNVDAVIARSAELVVDARHFERHQTDPAVLRGCTRLSEELRRLDLEIRRLEGSLADIEGIQKMYTAWDRAHRRAYRAHWYAPAGALRQRLEGAKKNFRTARDTVMRIREAHVR